MVYYNTVVVVIIMCVFVMKSGIVKQQYLFFYQTGIVRKNIKDCPNV